ncbi:NUDIX hydrolase [Kitasatospora indigofera]|uniref:NUDIX hydrolase n=1 Tax=Kitasatospora indigofera TaxID=67307 RepID=UPI0036CB607D
MTSAESPPLPGSVLPDIAVAAIALIRDRRVLMVTARGRDVLFMPGGKIDAGETTADAAVREAREEVSIDLRPGELHELFTVAVQAHGEPVGRLVRMHVFGVDAAAAASVTPAPSAEVSAVHWVGSDAADRCPPAGAEVLERLSAAGLID